MKIQNIPHFQSLFVGLNTQTPTLDGSKLRYINFDNGASTLPLKSVLKAVNDFIGHGYAMPWQITGKANKEAHAVQLTLYQDEEHPSYLALPVVKLYGKLT